MLRARQSLRFSMLRARQSLRFSTLAEPALLHAGRACASPRWQSLRFSML